MVGIFAFVLHLDGGGGHYPSYPAASFAKRTSPAASVAATSDALVQIDAGTLRGTHIGSTIAFRGIPYARPPVGELRWAAPLAAVPWQGVREAAAPRPACTQRAAGLISLPPPLGPADASKFSQPPGQCSPDRVYLH